MRSNRRRTAGLVLTVVLAGALGACGDDDAPPLDPGSTSTSSDATSSTPEPSSSTSDATSEPTSEPTGPEIALQGISLRVPAGYQVIGRSGEIGVSLREDRDLAIDEINVTSNGNLGLSYDTDFLAREHNRVAGYRRNPKRQDDVTVQGRTMFHVAGPTSAVAWVEAFGEGEGEYTVDIEFVFSLDDPVAHREAVVRAFLDDVRFT